MTAHLIIAAKIEVRFVHFSSHSINHHKTLIDWNGAVWKKTLIFTLTPLSCLPFPSAAVIPKMCFISSRPSVPAIVFNSKFNFLCRTNKKREIFWIKIKPGDPSVNGGSLAKSISNLLAAVRICSRNNRCAAVGVGINVVIITVVDLKGQGVICGGWIRALWVRHELSRRLNRRLGLAGESRVIYLRARVGGAGERLKTGESIRILVLGGEVRGGRWVVLDVRQGWVLSLRRIAGTGEEVLQLRRSHVYLLMMVVVVILHGFSVHWVRLLISPTWRK